MDLERNNIKLEKLQNFLKENLDLELLKHMDAFNKNPMPKNNYSLFKGMLNTLDVKPPKRNSKKYEKTMEQLCTLKSYLTHFSGLPTDNFLNTFENYESLGNKNVEESAKTFLETDSSLKGLWLHGESGAGKSHIMTSMIHEYLAEQINKEFSEYEKSQYPSIPIYGKENSETILPTYDNPNLIYINYMHDIVFETHYRYSAKPEDPKPFGYDNERSIYFLDDVCEKESAQILDKFLEMYDSKMGKTVITSNYSLSDWIKVANNGKSEKGLEGRLRSFIKEFKVEGKSREKTW